MEVKGNQNIFDFTLEKFGTLENLFDDVLVPNSLPVDRETQSNQEVNINAVGKGDDDVKMKISEQGLSMTNGDIPIIVEYRNGVVTDATEGGTAIFDFEAKINSSTPVVFTINWGAEVGTTVINSTLVNGVWKALQTSILIPVGVDLSQTINVTDSIGGSYQVGYTVEPIKILITMNMTTPSTAGINLTFASGSLSIDWKEGGGLVPFVSGVELTHTYSSAATYIAEISGSLENITKFIADNSKITQITDLKTGLLTDFKINNNLFSGGLNMSLAPISGIFWVNNNTGLTDVSFASSGNGLVTDFRAHICGLVGNFDVSNITVGTAFRTFSNPLLTGITFASSGNSKLTVFESYSCDLTGTFILANVPVSGYFDVRSNSNLTGLTFSSSGNTIITNFRAWSCDFSSLDFTNVPTGGLFTAYSNSNMTSITFASSGNSKFTSFAVQNCNLTGILDLSNNPISYIQVAGNPLLTDVTFSNSGNTAFTLTGMNLCALNYVDFSNVTLMLARNSINHHLEDNNMIAGDLNHILVDLAALVAGESGGGDYTGRIITAGGTNAAIDGTSGGHDGLTAKTNLEGKGFTVTVN